MSLRKRIFDCTLNSPGAIPGFEPIFWAPGTFSDGSTKQWTDDYAARYVAELEAVGRFPNPTIGGRDGNPCMQPMTDAMYQRLGVMDVEEWAPAKPTDAQILALAKSVRNRTAFPLTLNAFAPCQLFGEWPPFPYSDEVFVDAWVRGTNPLVKSWNINQCHARREIVSTIGTICAGRYLSKPSDQALNYDTLRAQSACYRHCFGRSVPLVYFALGVYEDGSGPIADPDGYMKVMMENCDWVVMWGDYASNRALICAGQKYLANG